jgi:hypothetical protein
MPMNQFVDISLGDTQAYSTLTQNNSKCLISDMDNPGLYCFTLYFRKFLITPSIHLEGIWVWETSNRFNLYKTAGTTHTE